MNDSIFLTLYTKFCIYILKKQTQNAHAKITATSLTPKSKMGSKTLQNIHNSSPKRHKKRIDKNPIKHNLIHR